MTCDEAAIIIMLLNLTFAIKQLFLLGFRYPSHQQYSDMVRTLFNRCHILSRNWAIVRMLWKYTVSGWELISRMPENDCQMQFRKREGMAWEVKNYLPLYQVGEDASTMDVHREQLHDKYNQSSAKKDQRIIRKLMNLTIPHWRNLLIRKMATIREVTDLYPLLHDETQVTWRFFITIFLSTIKKLI